MSLYNSKTVRIFALVGAIALVASLVVAVFPGLDDKFNNNSAQNKAVDPLKDVRVVRKSPSKLPDQFPVNLPLEADAKVTNNYNAKLDDGSLQGTREYESAKTPEQNYSLFLDFFKNNNWTILSSSNKNGTGSIMASNNGTTVQVLFYRNTSNSKSTVRISSNSVVQK